jgi:LemA protein
MSVTIIAWIALFALGLWGLGAYNRLVRRRNEIANAYAQIDVQLKRRHDLIPNLVETAKKYVTHERSTLEAVIQARNISRSAADAAKSAPLDAGRMAALGNAEAALAGSLGKLMVVVEAYPELKADATLRDLSEELGHTENRIAFARQAFNDTVLTYNNTAQQAPTNVVAKVFNFAQAGMLNSTSSDEERAAVKVQF